jgi:hypothetical protein
MRRSILIVMLDVMVLSVLALTAGQRSGAAGVSVPVPMYRWSSMIEESLRKEQAFQDQVAQLEAQLAEAASIAKKALEQAEKSQAVAGEERAGNLEMQSQLREAELAAERARSRAAAAEREMQLAAEKIAQAEQQVLEMEKRETDARTRAEKAGARARAAEEAAQEAERKALAVERAGAAIEQEMERIRSAQRLALEKATVSSTQVEALQNELDRREQALQVAQTESIAARERASATAEERERLLLESRSKAEELARLREQMAALEVRKEIDQEKLARLEEDRRRAEEERRKSVWVRRDEALRRLTVSYVEYHSHNDQSFRTNRELAMPVVKVGRTVLIPADFRKLGLAKSFFGGLSDRITDVRGMLSPVSGAGPQLPIRSIVVPGREPQVCYVEFDGEADGALESITMESLKEGRLKTALLFSPDDVNEHGRVEISPMFGGSYLNVRAVGGKKPGTGDYLMSDTGQFIGVMVTSEACYVTPQVLSRQPEPLRIPVASARQDEVYFTEFIQQLNLARERVKAHLARRQL